MLISIVSPELELGIGNWCPRNCRVLMRFGTFHQDGIQEPCLRGYVRRIGSGSIVFAPARTDIEFAADLAEFLAHLGHPGLGLRE